MGEALLLGGEKVMLAKPLNNRFTFTKNKINDAFI
ncbi:MAG: hypothetical protein KBD83_03870 [Gammaproteobacteria bacterium]|jgi:hypothetical protein|nr:hypothetical protein [Gammaproteobacteria bacterium]